MLMRLHGREAEMARLLSIADRRGHAMPAMAVLFGRRRVGKTFLLMHVAALLQRDQVEVVHYTATREASGTQLARLAEMVGGATGSSVTPANWYEFWSAVAEIARRRPLALLLDEVPYLVESDPAWASVLQAAWDVARHSEEPTRLGLVLTGSAIGTMTQLVSSRGALFERPDETIRLDPFDLPIAASFRPFTSAIAAIEAYAACDGYPLLLERWDPCSSTLDNLVRLAGDPFGALAANASTLMLDLPDFDTYQRVLAVIGRGAHKPSEIHGRLAQRPDRPLQVLERAGFISRRYPIGDRSRRSVQLGLADNYLRFWFSIVEPNEQLIDGGQGGQVVRGAAPLWANLVASTFEREARRHLARTMSEGGVVGEWWTDRPTQVQIDVVLAKAKTWELVGEVKWKDRFTMTDLHQFERNVRKAGQRADRARLAVWSKHGLTDDLAVIRPDIQTFVADDLISRR